MRRSCQTSKSHRISANHHPLTTAPSSSSSYIVNSDIADGRASVHVNVTRIRAPKRKSAHRTNRRRSTAVAIRNEDETFHPILYGVMDEADPDALRFIPAEFGAELKNAVAAGNAGLKRYFTIINHEEFQVMMNEFCSNVWEYKSSGIDVKKHFRGCKVRCRLPDGVKTPKVFSLTQPNGGLAFHVKYVKQQRKKGKKDEKSMFIGQTPLKHSCRAYTRSLLALMQGCPVAAGRVHTLTWNQQANQFTSENTIPPFIQQLIQQNKMSEDADEEDSLSTVSSDASDSVSSSSSTSVSNESLMEEDEEHEELASAAESIGNGNQQANAASHTVPGTRRRVTFDPTVYIAPDLLSMNSDDTAGIDEDQMSIDQDPQSNFLASLTPIPSPRVISIVLDPFAVEDQPLSPTFSLPTPIPDEFEVSSQDSDDTFALAMRAPSFSL